MEKHYAFKQEQLPLKRHVLFTLVAIMFGVCNQQLLAQGKNNQQILLSFGLKPGEKVMLTLKGNGAIKSQGLQEPLQFGINTEYTLTSSEVVLTGNITSLRCQKFPLKGINLTKASSLEELNLSNTGLTQLDLKTNTQLKSLNLQSNSLKSIDLSNNTNLEVLYLSHNKLSTLILKSNNKLKEFDCSFNPLATMDLSSLKKLESADLQNCALKELVLGTLPELYLLYCNNNKIEKLDFTGCENIEEVSVYSNNISARAMAKLLSSLPDADPVVHGSILVIDTNNRNEQNHCWKEDVLLANKKNWIVKDNKGGNEVPYEGENKVTQPSTIKLATNKATGDVITLEIVAKGNVTLLGIDGEFANNATKEYTITDPKNITITGDVTSLNCSGNELTELGLNNTELLSVLDCSNNKLQQLNLSQAPALEILLCSNNKLSALETNYIPNLSKLWCSNNPLLNELNLAENTKLISLWCYNCNLKTLNIKPNTNLTGLDCRNNKLTELILPQSETLTRILCNNNKLESLLLKGLPNLDELNCGFNALTELEVLQNPYLASLSCNNNKLLHLDVSKNTELKELYCQFNHLTQLNLQPNKKIEVIWCFNNNIMGKPMTDFVLSLKTIRAGDYSQLMLVNTPSTTEQNVATVDDVNTLKSKGWKPLDFSDGANNKEGMPYDGVPTASDKVLSGVEYSCMFDSSKSTLLLCDAPYSSVQLYSLSGNIVATAQCNAWGKAYITLKQFVAQSTYIVTTSSGKCYKVQVNR